MHGRGRILVVNGVSNAGKSTLREWLVETLHFRSIDCDDVTGRSTIDGLGLRVQWTSAEYGNPEPFIHELARRDGDWVMDWPYNPPDSFSIVSALQGLGVCPWWLDADLERARQSFLDRARGELSEFDDHAASIRVHRVVIQAVYGPRVLLTLDGTGARTPPQEIWSAICRMERWAW
jgi:hypothetical protein